MCYGISRKSVLMLFFFNTQFDALLYISPLNLFYVPLAYIYIYFDCQVVLFSAVYYTICFCNLRALSIKWPLLAHASIANIHLMAHDDVMTWKHFPFVWGFTSYRRFPLTKWQWRGVACFLWRMPEHTVDQTVVAGELIRHSIHMSLL